VEVDTIVPFFLGIRLSLSESSSNGVGDELKDTSDGMFGTSMLVTDSKDETEEESDEVALLPHER
jgi:hypothetical protein